MPSDNTNQTKVFFGVDQPQNQNHDQPTPAWHISSDPQDATPVAPSIKPQPIQPQNTPPQPIIDVVQKMQTVKTDTPEANLNKDSMSDNNGGRITFNEDKAKMQTIKGVEDPNRILNKKK